MLGLAGVGVRVTHFAQHHVLVPVVGPFQVLEVEAVGTARVEIGGGRPEHLYGLLVVAVVVGHTASRRVDPGAGFAGGGGEPVEGELGVGELVVGSAEVRHDEVEESLRQPGTHVHTGCQVPILSGMDTHSKAHAPAPLLAHVVEEFTHLADEASEYGGVSPHLRRLEEDAKMAVLQKLVPR